MSRRWAKRQAQQMVADTCPHIDTALAVAAESIKHQTVTLRNALVAAIERAIEAEDQVKALERDLAGLKSEVPLPEFEKGERVATPDGEGCITHIDTPKPARYHVHLGRGFGDVYLNEQLTRASPATPTAAPEEKGGGPRET